MSGCAIAGRGTPQYDRLAALCAAHPGWQLLPGTDGMVHVSELSHGYVKTVTDVIKIGDSVRVAQQRAYEGVRSITMPDAVWRGDIGHRAIKPR